MSNGLAALLLFIFALSGCGGNLRKQAAAATGGDVSRGAGAIARYGCGACHTIGGIYGAHGLVGPSLDGVRNRLYIAGVLRNQPDYLELWIKDPKGVNHRTAMPNVGVTPTDAIDIAAYLYSLK